MSYSAAVLADSPAGYWRCDDASGNPQDSSGNAQHSDAVFGAPTIGYRQTGAISSDGSSNYGFEFVSGAGDSINVPDSTTLDLGDVYTLEAWMKRRVSGERMRLFSKGIGAYAMEVDASDFFYSTVESTIVLVYSTITVSDLAWHHYVATKNGATNKVYIDGIDRSGTVTNATAVNTATDLRIGSDYVGIQCVNGWLDEAAVYPTELSAARVLAHYNAATATVFASDTPRPIMGRGATW